MGYMETFVAYDLISPKQTSGAFVSIYRHWKACADKVNGRRAELDMPHRVLQMQ